MPDQKAETVAKLFVEQIVCRHGIPEELLSDRGANFLSTLVQDICKTLGVRKINTSGYHPQTDGLVEKFNSTLTNMIAKSCDVRDRDWDDQLPFLLFAYRSSAQESTKESPFFLMHGRDPRIPTETVLTSTRSPYAADMDVDLCSDLTTAWGLAKTNIKEAQLAQKTYYDKFSKSVDLKVGDKVNAGRKTRKDVEIGAALPWSLISVTNTNAEVRLISSPKDESMFVHLNRIRKCNPQQGDEVWTGSHKRWKRRVKTVETSPVDEPLHPYAGPVTRSRAREGRPVDLNEFCNLNSNVVN